MNNSFAWRACRSVLASNTTFTLMSRVLPLQRLWSQRYSRRSQWIGKCVCWWVQLWPSTSADQLETEMPLQGLIAGWKEPWSLRGLEHLAGKWNSPPERTAEAKSATGAEEVHCLRENRKEGSRNKILNKPTCDWFRVGERWVWKGGV